MKEIIENQDKSQANRPVILVSNDDGYQAPGVHRLVDWLKPYGKVVAVCPDGPRSGQSMAITVNGVLRLINIEEWSDEDAEWYRVNGTPVDCIKLAIHTLFKEKKPGLVASGINHGSNSAVNVLYSGTMGAAMEGAILGVPSIGFSLTSHAMDADFSQCKKYIQEIVGRVIREGLPEGICLNVNIPATKGKLQGIRTVRSCGGHWSDEYAEYTDPSGKKFYLLTGKFVNTEPDAEDTDEWCLSHDIVSVVPIEVSRG
ncbi:MAG: 5'/3'-nucleotidase SurE [Clostridium sp.]|nr:5'/3'-nucleotidase SurE [Prevotella sp.]MCM1428887.1 5'/3'-nucleotidase SurE [Clostridium sp.]MCM1475266.1 5'/3'-nucleotidase SurE [Muribaculaceae bacterium]